MTTTALTRLIKTSAPTVTRFVPQSRLKHLLGALGAAGAGGAGGYALGRMGRGRPAPAPASAPALAPEQSFKPRDLMTELPQDIRQILGKGQNAPWVAGGGAALGGGIGAALGGKNRLLGALLGALAGGAGGYALNRYVGGHPMLPKTGSARLEKTAILGRAIRGLGRGLSGGGMNLLRRGMRTPGMGGFARRSFGRMGTGVGNFLTAHPYMSATIAGPAAAAPFAGNLKDLLRRAFVGGPGDNQLQKNMTERQRLMQQYRP